MVNEAPTTFRLVGATMVNPLTESTTSETVCVSDGHFVGSCEAQLELSAEGCYVMPGLIDMHVHLVPSFVESRALTDDVLGVCKTSIASALAGGVTSLRDVGGSLDVMLTLRRMQRDGQAKGSRVFLAGPVLTMPNGHGLHSGHGIAVGSAADAASVVASLHDAGVDLIKIVTSGARGDVQMPADVLSAISTAAQECSLPVAAHAHFQHTQLDRCIDAPVSTIEHGFLLNQVEDAFERMASNRVALCPTLRVIESIRAEPDWRGQRIIPQAWNDALDSVRLAYQAGVQLLAGTDSGVFGVSPTDVWREVSLIAEATGSRWAGLRAATANAATALRRSDLGNLNVGSTADFVIVSRDPVTREVGPSDVQAVFQGGALVAGSVEPLIRG